jgi:hypothetical protein
MRVHAPAAMREPPTCDSAILTGLSPGTVAGGNAEDATAENDTEIARRTVRENPRECVVDRGAYV